MSSDAQALGTVEIFMADLIIFAAAAISKYIFRNIMFKVLDLKGKERQ